MTDVGPGEGPPAREGGPRLVPPAVFASPRAVPRLPAVVAPLLPLFVLDVLTAFTVGMLPPLLPLLVAEWGLGAVEAGLVNTTYSLGRLAGSYPASRARARWGTRAAIFTGLAGLIGGSLGCALAPTFALLLASRFLMGLGGSVAMFAMFAELLEMASPSWRGRAANAYEAAGILSLAVGAVLASAGAQRAGWRVVFVGAAGVMALGFVTWRTISPHAGRQRPAEAASPGRPAASLRALMPVYGACLAMTATWAGLFATLLPLVADRRYGVHPTTIGLAMGAGYVADVVGLAAVGLVIDRVRQEPLFLGGALTVMIGAALLMGGTAPPTFVAATVLISVGFAVWVIPATVLTARAGTPLPPGHLAMLRIAMDFGMIVGPLAIGATSELVGDGTAAMAASAMFVVGALVLVRSGARWRR